MVKPAALALVPALVPALILSAAPTAASAQSSVTLFGVVDVAVRHVKNGDKSVSSLGSSGLDKSRIGMRGIEDLGDGLKAGFWLESGINVDSGSQFEAARFWNRRATVSLIGSFGELRLGRDFTPTYLGWSSYDAFGTNGVGSADRFVANFGTAIDTLTRSDNQVMYFTPNGLGGIYAIASVAAGEGQQGRKYYGGRVGQAAGPYDLSVAYGETRVAPNLAGVDKFKVASVGGSYDFGMLVLMGYWHQMKFGNLKLTAANIGVQLPLGPGKLRASFIDANAAGAPPAGASTDANDARQFALGYVYEPSKRTGLYGTVARINNKGTASFAVSTPPPVPAGRHSTGYEVGLRHKF